MFWLKNQIASGKETVAEPPGTLPRTQEPLRSQSEARNRNDYPACTKSELMPSVFIKTHYWMNHR